MEADPEPQPAAVHDSAPVAPASLGTGIAVVTIARLGLCVVAALMGSALRHAASLFAAQRTSDASASLDQLQRIKVAAYVLTIVAIAAIGWWTMQIDRSAGVLGKFHKRGSTASVFACVLLIPLFELSDRVDVLKVGGRGGIDFRPAVTTLLVAAVVWLSSGRLRAALDSLGEQLLVRRAQVLFDLLAIGVFWSAWSRTRLDVTNGGFGSDASHVGNLVTTAATLGLISTVLALVMMLKINGVVRAQAREANKPPVPEIDSFVVRPVWAAPASTTSRPMLPLAPWRWALLASYAIWIATHLVAAVTYLHIRGLLDSDSTTAKIDHQVSVSAIVSLSGFVVVYLAQWAWVIVTVHNANRATLVAPPLVLVWLFASVPVVIAVIAIGVGGTGGVNLAVLAALLGFGSFFASFRMSRSAVASVGGDLISMRSWSLAVSLSVVIQFAANLLRPPSVQQVLLLAMATLTAQAVALAVALRIATRVTADANRSFLEFRQIKRLD